jgi:hypothetical protein
MSVLERFIGELEAAQARVALDSLTAIPDSEKTEFGFGKAVGRVEGLRQAGELLEKVLREAEAEKRGTRRNFSPA